MIDPQFCKWDPAISRSGDGVLVGADISQEYLLPWWWKHYIRHNSYPITWIDLGLSASMKEWCRERGEVVPLRVCSELFMVPKEEVLIKSPAHIAESKNRSRPMYANPFKTDSELWIARNAWFKKPFAMLQSSYKRTVWLDCDCEVRGNIKELFDFCSSHEVAIRKDVARPPFVHYHGSESSYNTGVVAFQSGCSLFELWAKLSIERNQNYYTDDHLITDIILEHNFSVYDLPCTYNRMYGAGEKQEGALIFHWSGLSGKHAIKLQMSMENLNDLTMYTQTT